MNEPAGFSSLGLSAPLLDALTALGYQEPTPIQRAAIPPLLEGRDLLGQAATGTGKTAAFALPLLQRVSADKRTRALVLVPTRELAMQVATAIRRYGQGLGTQVLAIYGGAAMSPQVQALSRGVTVVVATPGRALDHLRRGTLKLEGVEVVVLDEADEMLDMGFAEDLEALLQATPPERQTALFSATLPPRIAAIAGRHLREPVRVSLMREAPAPGTLPKVEQRAYTVSRTHKPAALARVLDVEAPASAIVFCRTRSEVDEVTETLGSRGARAEALHGGLSQEQRDRVMKRFRTGAVTLLVATDVAARGLDIEHVSHVINYDVPAEPETYVHRIGRTGRAGRAGIAITLTDPREHRRLKIVESLTRARIQVMPVPSVAELRTRQLERLRASLRDTVAGGELERYRGVVDSLASEFDVRDLCAAALQLAHQATTPAAAETEIPSGRPPAPGRNDRGDRGDRGDRPGYAPAGPGFGPGPRPSGPPERRRRPSWPVARIFIGAGHDAGIRPADLVGAIANEAGVDSRAVGAIQIGERASQVEVPAEIADAVIEALRATRIKGKKPVIRHDRAGYAPPTRARPYEARPHDARPHDARPHS